MQQRRHQDVDDLIGIHGPEYATINPRLDCLAHQFAATRHHFVEIELGDIGKILRFRHHQLRNAAEVGGADQLPPAEQQLVQQGGRIVAMALEQRLALFQRRYDTLADDGFEQRFLAIEIQIERAFRHAGACGNLVQPCGSETALDEQRERGRRQFLRPRLLAARETGARFLRLRVTLHDFQSCRPGR